MKFLIVLLNGECFETNYYEYSDYWSDKLFLVINQDLKIYSTNGISFKPIQSIYDVHR